MKDIRQNKRLKLILNVFTWVLLILVIALLFLFTGIRIFGIKPYIVNSPSMNPIYKPGSMIYVKSIDVKELKTGDIITFYFSPIDTATHKIDRIDYEKGEIYTYGINNTDSEGKQMNDPLPVSFNDIVGVPILCIPCLGNVYCFITTSPGVYLVSCLCIIVTLVSLLLDSEVLSRKKCRAIINKRGKL